MRRALLGFCQRKPDPDDFSFIDYVGIKDVAQKRRSHGTFSEQMMYGLRPAPAPETRFKLGYLPVMLLICTVYLLDHLHMRSFRHKLGKYREQLEAECRKKSIELVPL